MSIFTIYKKKEDQVTSTLLALLKYSQRSVLEKFLDELVGFQFDLISFVNQPRKLICRPDAEIYSNFQIVIESKIDSTFNPEQSANHLKSFNIDFKNEIFIIISKEEINNDELIKLLKNNSSIEIKNILWSDVYDFFDKINKDIINYNEKTRFLAEQFCIYLEDIKLDSSWKKRVVILPGEISLKQAKRYGLSLWPTSRITKRFKYVSFYDKKQIELLFEIKLLLTFNFQGTVPSSIKEFKEGVNLILGKRDFIEQTYNNLLELEKKQDHPWGFTDYVYIIYFDKEENKLKEPIIHSEKGAFIQRPSYTTLDKIESATTTSDIREGK